MAHIIKLRGLSKTYRKGPRALAGVDLDIAESSRFTLLGANGAGKSTLVRILCTLLHADAGTAGVCGHELSGGTAAIRACIGVALQDTQLDPDSSARSQLRFQARLFGQARRQAEARADELIASFGLEPVADRKAVELSGGNKRRLHVALALVHRPQVLFLDEPTIGMDPESRVAFWAEMRRLNAEEGTTVFFTTQYLEEAAKHGDQLALIDEGAIAYRGSVRDFLEAHAGPEGDLESGYLNFLAEKRGKESIHA
jgi:ABC-2 type transport system ATP-binding protein